MFRFAEAFISLRADIRPMAQSLDRAKRQVELFASRFQKITIGAKIDGSINRIAKSINNMSNSMSKASARFAKSSVMYRKTAKGIERSILGSMVPKANRANLAFAKFAGNSAKVFTREFGKSFQKVGRVISRGGFFNAIDRSVNKFWKNNFFRGGAKGVRNIPYIKNLFDLYNVPQKIKAPNISVAAKKARQFVGSRMAMFGAGLQNHPAASGLGKWVGKQFENLGVAINNDRVKKAIGNGIKSVGKFISNQAPMMQKMTKAVFKGVGSGVIKSFSAFIKYAKPFQWIQAALGGLAGAAGVALSGFGKLGSFLLGPFGKILGTVTDSIFGLVNYLGKLAVSGSIVIGGALMFSAKAAGDVESLMVNIGRVADISGNKLESLKEKLLEIAKASTGASTEEVLQIAEFGARLGIGEGSPSKGNAIANFTKDISKLKLALDDIPVEEATTRIVRILNVFGEGHDKILNFASALTRLDNASTATGRDILDLTRRLSGVAGTMGMLPEDVMALAASMRDMGIEVEVGGTSISQLLVRMSADAENFAKVMKLSAKELKNTIDTNPLNAVRMVLESLSKYNPRSQLAMISQLHLQGQRTSSTILQLAKGFGKLDGFIRMARDDWESLNSVEEAAALRSQTLWSKLQKLWNQLTVLRVEIGDRLMPSLKELADLFGDVFDYWTQALKNNRVAIDGYVAKVTKVISFLRSALTDIPATSKMVQDSIALIWEEIEENAYNTFQKIKNLFQTIWDVKWKAAGEIIGKIIDALKVAIQAAWEGLKALGKMIGSAIFDGIASAAEGTFFGDMFLSGAKKPAAAPNPNGSSALGKISGAFGSIFKGGPLPGVNLRDNSADRKNRWGVLGKQANAMAELFSHKGGLNNAQFLASLGADAASGLVGKISGSKASAGNYIYQNTDRKIEKRSVEREKQYEKRISDAKKLNQLRSKIQNIMKTGNIPGDISRGLGGLATSDLDQQVAKDGKFLDQLRRMFPNSQATRERAAGGATAYAAMQDRVFNYEKNRQDIQKFYGGDAQKHEKGQDERTRDNRIVKGLGDIGKGLASGLGLAGRVAGALNANPALQAVGMLSEKVANKIKRKRKVKGGFQGVEASQVPEDYKPEFFDLVDFSRKIQTDIFDKKKNDPTIMAIDDLGNKIDRGYNYQHMVLGDGSGKSIQKTLQDISNNGIVGIAG